MESSHKVIRKDFPRSVSLSPRHYDCECCVYIGAKIFFKKALSSTVTTGTFSFSTLTYGFLCAPYVLLRIVTLYESDMILGNTFYDCHCAPSNSLITTTTYAPTFCYVLLCFIEVSLSSAAISCDLWPRFQQYYHTWCTIWVSGRGLRVLPKKNLSWMNRCEV